MRYLRQNGYLHMEHCKMGEGGKITEKIKASDRIPECCGRELLIRIGAKDFDKHKEEYTTFFEKVGIRLLRKFYLTKGYKTVFQNGTLFVNGKEDDFKIVIGVDGTISLWHNNYRKYKNGEVRKAVSGFHEHRLKYNEPWLAISEIAGYEYSKEHVVSLEQMVDRLVDALFPRQEPA